MKPRHDVLVQLPLSSITDFVSQAASYMIHVVLCDSTYSVCAARGSSIAHQIHESVIIYCAPPKQSRFRHRILHTATLVISSQQL